MKHIYAFAVVCLFLVLGLINTNAQSQSGHVEFYGLSEDEFKLWAEALRNREPQPVPTYTVMINSEDGKPLRIFIEGSYVKPSGKVVEIERHEVDVPTNLYMNADCHLRLRIGTEVAGRRFTVITLYEHEETVKHLATMKAMKGDRVILDYPPYQER